MKLEEDADGFGTDRQIVVYGTMTHQSGRNILWYPDRKFFFLGKEIK